MDHCPSLIHLVYEHAPMCTTALGSFFFHPAERQSLSCLKVEMQTEAVFQTLPQSTLVTGRALDQELSNTHIRCTG